MAGLPEIIDDLRRRVTELERRQRAQLRTGVIEEVDAGNGVARVRLQDGPEGPFLTGWIPWAEPSAGANKTHNPPTVGAQVQLTSESGDLHDAVIQGSLNSDANGRPSSSGDVTTIAKIGDIEVTAAGGAFTVKAGGVTVTFSGDGLAVDGGQVTHNGTDIGDTHTHSGVMAGPADTGTPN